jgi:hypothetical protein
MVPEVKQILPGIVQRHQNSNSTGGGDIGMSEAIGQLNWK